MDLAAFDFGLSLVWLTWGQMLFQSSDWDGGV